jgi:hypothetical protein
MTSEIIKYKHTKGVEHRIKTYEQWIHHDAMFSEKERPAEYVGTYFLVQTHKKFLFITYWKTVKTFFADKRYEVLLRTKDAIEYFNNL